MTASFRVALVEPEIPWNTGNVGRTCLALGGELILVGKLGFSLEDRYLKRAGLDYWPSVPLKQLPDIETLLATAPTTKTFFFSTKATRPYWETDYPADALLVFGPETRGLPDDLRHRFPDRFFRIPMTGPVRSLNLSTAVGIVVGEVLRQAAQRVPAGSSE